MGLREGGLFGTDPFNTYDGYDSILEDQDSLLVTEQESIFPLALLPELLAAKAKYPNVFLMSVRGYKILYRLLTKAEFESYEAIKRYNGDSQELKLAIIDNVMLGCLAVFGDWKFHKLSEIPLEKLKAYTIPSICDHILKLSNFSDPAYIQELQDFNNKNLEEGYLDAVLGWHIKSNINNITSENLANMNVAEYGELLGAISFYSKGESRLKMSQDANNKV